VQGGKETVRALGTCTEGDVSGENRYEKAPPDLTPLKDCIPIPELPRYTIFHHMDVRLDPGCAGWMSGRLTEKSELKGWIRFKDGRPFDQLSILLLADSFPPPVLASQGVIAWIPTIEMSVNIRSLPKAKWLRCIFCSRFINSGFVEEDGELWDENGEIVAISRQISQFQKK
jgi:acyl-CoA thioesterase